MEDFMLNLAKPRVIVIMVDAGRAVDSVIDAMLPHLAPGDILIDGGNEIYTETERREKMISAKNIHYIGMGISGGEEGARYGPSLMPGGNRAAYDLIAPKLLQIAAKASDNQPCVDYIGPGGSGNFVKMVHNGIEYADMQMIAEIYSYLKIKGLNNKEIHDAFYKYKTGPLSSFLIDITCDILSVRASQSEHTISGSDAEYGTLLVDRILDVTGMKGTGTWTVQQAAAKGVAIPSISAALTSRQLSAAIELRSKLADVLISATIPTINTINTLTSENRTKAVEDIVQKAEDALLVAKIAAYAQGFDLLRIASQDHQWNLQLGSISTLWRAGCIIRAKLLDSIHAAYKTNENESESGQLQHLLLAPYFSTIINEKLPVLRQLVIETIQAEEPAIALTSSVNYIDALKKKRLPTNLTQAQRDYFGAHTFKRIDIDGVFHEKWSELAEDAKSMKW